MSRILNQPAMPKCIRGWGGEESSILEGEERGSSEDGWGKTMVSDTEKN